MWTKRQVINAAFAEIGLGSAAYDSSPEDLQDALNRLNALGAELSGHGAALQYPSVNSVGLDDLDATSNLPPDAVRGVICMLAMDIAPSYGRQPSPITISAAASGRALMLRKGSIVPDAKIDTRFTPAGAGNRLSGGYSRITLYEHDNNLLPGEAGKP